MNVGEAMSPSELGWVVGLFEGEGCTYLKNDSRRSHLNPHPVLQVKMVDKDVIDRLHSTTGIGNVYQSNPTVTGKDTWVWRVSRDDDVVSLLRLMLPLMGERRSKKAREALVAVNA